MNPMMKIDISTWLFDSRMKTKEDELVACKTVEISPTREMTMETLPIEVLSHILKYLSPIDRLRSEQVCKKWRDASRYNWRDVQILCISEPNEDCRFSNRSKLHELVEKEGNRLFIGIDSPKIIRCLVSRVGYFIKKFIFNYPSSENHRAILSVVNSYCHNLKIFETGSIIKGDDEKSFTRLFECNKELNSIGCHRSVHFVEVIPLRDWKSLKFGICKELHEDKIVSLIEHSEALEEFEIVDYTKRMVKALLKRRNLKSLYFRTNHKVSLGMIFDVPLLNRLTNLCVFDIEFNLNMFCNMLQHCRQLKRLELKGFSRDDPVKLLETIQALPVLETLKLSYYPITDDILINLIKVRNLCLDYCIKNLVTNNGILQMIRKSEILDKLDIKRANVTPEMFKQLVGEMSHRSKYLEVMVPYNIFNEVSEICAGSKIRVVREMECFEY